jgi:hypothetical protein
MTRIWIERRTHKAQLGIERDGLILVGRSLTAGGMTMAVSPSWALILKRLMLAPGYVTIDELIETRYPNPDLEPSDPYNTIRQFIVYLRPILQRLSYDIPSGYHRGYIFEKLNEVPSQFSSGRWKKAA